MEGRHTSGTYDWVWWWFRELLTAITIRERKMKPLQNQIIVKSINIIPSAEEEAIEGSSGHQPASSVLVGEERVKSRIEMVVECWLWNEWMDGQPIGSLMPLCLIKSNHSAGGCASGNGIEHICAMLTLIRIKTVHLSFSHRALQFQRMADDEDSISSQQQNYRTAERWVILALDWNGL